MFNQEIEKKVRNARAKEYEDWYLQKGYFFDWLEKKVILNALNLKQSDIVLDASCGTGSFTYVI